MAIDSPWNYSFRLWFLTNTGGTLALALYCTAVSTAIEGSGVALIIGLFAASFSLPAIPLAVFLFNRIITFPKPRQRQILALLSVTGLWFMAFLSTGFLFNAKELFRDIVYFTSPFAVAAWLAVAFVYRRWLFTEST